MTPDDSSPRLPPLWTTAAFAVLALALDLAVDVAAGGTLQQAERFIAALDRDGGAFSRADVAQVQSRLDVLAVVSPVVFILSIVATGLFLRAAWLAATALGAGELRYGPRWAVFGWFVPVMFLVVPKRIVDDVWRGADVGSTQPHLSMRRRPALVTVWWTVFLVTLLAQRLVTGSPPALFLVLVLDVASALLTTAVVVALAVRLTRLAGARRRHLPLPALLRGPRVAAPLWLHTGLTATAAALLVVALGVGVREGSRLPEPLRAQEAAALAAPREPGTPLGSLLPAQPSPLAIPPSAGPPALDPRGPFESSLLEPPGFTRVTDDPDYAGAYDLERLVASTPEADRETTREVLESFGFVQAQQAAFDTSEQALEVVVLELGSPDAATEWVAQSAAVAEGTFPVTTAGGTGHRTTVDDTTVLDVVEVAVGSRVYTLSLFQPARFTTAEAGRLLQLQVEAAAEPTA